MESKQINIYAIGLPFSSVYIWNCYETFMEQLLIGLLLFQFIISYKQQQHQIRYYNRLIQIKIKKLLNYSRIVQIFKIVYIFKYHYKLQHLLIKIIQIMNIDTQDLETFLIEAELINQKVKALAENKMSVEEFDKLEQARAQDKRKRQQAKKRIQRQAVQRRRLGRQGKGITKDFHNFCRYCHRQYELPTPLCLKCNRNTMTLNERQQQLALMVNQYKEKKKKRAQRKVKWDMWQKTKSMLWKKTSNNYDKWQYFVSDSQQQAEKEPIVPKDDPNFKALQRDMEERKALRIKQTKKAKQLKQKGNVFMKQANYEQAKNMYTLAFQHIKDIKSVYTNRALAYIKLGKYKKAVKDCTDVIDYMEVFQKVQENKDLVFKAYLRRAVAKKQMKDYRQALDDVKKALTIYHMDKSAQILKKEIEGFIQHNAKVQKLLNESKKVNQQKSKQQKQKQQLKQQQDLQQQNAAVSQKIDSEQNKIIKQLAQAQLANQAKQKQLQENKYKQTQASVTHQKKPNLNDNKQFNDPVQQIKYRLENLSQQNITAIFRLLRQKPQYISIFIAAKGIQKCLEQLIISQQCRKEGFLISVCLRGDGVGEREVWNFGINKIHNTISTILANPNQMDLSKYFILQDIFEVLIPMSLHQKYRIQLSGSSQVFKFIEKTFSQLITKYKKQPDLFSSVIIYMGNLCSGDSKLRDVYITEQMFQIVVNLLYEKVIIRKTVNRAHLNLKKNVYSLLANSVINQKHRTKLIQILNEKQISSQVEDKKWSQLVKQVKFYPKSNQNFDQYMLSLLSVFTNVTLGTSITMPDLAEAINERFLSNPSQFNSEIINRALLTLSRLKYKQIKLFKPMLLNFEAQLDNIKKAKGQKNPLQQIVRLLNVMYAPLQDKTVFAEPFPNKLFLQLKSYISSLQCGEILFCNTCNLFSIILDSSTEYGNKTYLQLLPNIKFLIEVAKDKIGNWRKNSAILLAKLSRNQDCKKQLDKNHGMDVLKSIAQFIK